MKATLLSIAFCLSIAGGFAQNLHLDAKANSGLNYSAALSKQFESYAQFSLSIQELLPQLLEKAEATKKIKFSFPGLPMLETELNTVEMFSENYATLIQTEAGLQVQHERPAIYAYRGKINGRPNSRVALTITADIISGFFDLGDGNIYYIEPVRSYDPSAARDAFVLYNNSDVLESDSERLSLAKEVAKYSDKNVTGNGAESDRLRCDPKKLEVGIANDYQMVLLFGSVNAVIAHDLTVMNLVQTNFDNEFVQPLRLKIANIFVSSCATCDPWSLTSDYDQLYIEFADWLNAGGFGSGTIDWGLLLTPREIDGNISGYTFPNGMCEYYRATLVINYTDILCKLQKHVAHGLGISFGASQTSTGIMRPGGICSNDWEPISITQINQAILTKPCLSTCVAQPPGQPYPIPCIWPTIPVCLTFDNPCVASYGVGTDDPTLTVTTSGTTICMQTLVEGFRIAHVFVFANDFCGNISSVGVSWTVNIDCHDPERNEIVMEEQAENLSVTQDNDFVFVHDKSAMPEQKTIRVFDMNGKLIQEQADASSLIQIPLHALPTGLYVVRVNVGEKVLVSRVYHF